MGSIELSSGNGGGTAYFLLFIFVIAYVSAFTGLATNFVGERTKYEKIARSIALGLLFGFVYAAIDYIVYVICGEHTEAINPSESLITSTRMMLSFVMFGAGVVYLFSGLTKEEAKIKKKVLEHWFLFTCATITGTFAPMGLYRLAVKFEKLGAEKVINAMFIGFERVMSNMLSLSLLCAAVFIVFTRFEASIKEIKEKEDEC